MRPAASFLAFVMVLLMVLFTLAAGRGSVGLGSQEEAACAAVRSTIKAEPARATPSGTFELRGSGFYGDYICNDTNFSGRPGETSGPLPDNAIRIEFLQGEKTWSLATVGSDKNLAFETKLKVPVDAKPGRAVVRAKGSNTGTVSGMSNPATTSFVVLNTLPKTGGTGVQDLP